MDSKDALFLQQSLSDFPVMIWKWDLARDTFMSSAHVANFLRRENNPAKTLTMDEWIDRTHPDDRLKLATLRENLHACRIETFSLLYRTMDIQESWRWIMSQGQVTARDEWGKPTEATGITIDQTRQRETEEKVLQSELKLTTLFDALEDIIFVCDPGGTLLKTNAPPLARALFGEERLEGRNLEKLLTGMGVPAESISLLLPDDPSLTSLSLTDRNGKIRFLELKTRPGKWENRPAFFGTFHDFSERKRALKELKLRREQLELALESAGGGLWDHDLRSGEISLDERSLLILEHPDGSTVPFDRIVDYIHPDDFPLVLELLNRHIHGLTPLFSIEYRVILPRDRTKWILQRGRICRRDSKGNPLRMRGTIMDISEHKKAEEARIALQGQLAESEKRLKLALEATEDGLWDWDLKNDTVFISDNWVDMLGYTSEDIPNSAKVLFEIMHPEDKERARKKLRDHLEGNTPFYKAEFRALTKSGEWKWILSRGRIVSRSADGTPLRIVGTHTDISGRISSQREIEKLEAKLREASTHDSLTGVLNRQAFRSILNRETDRSQRHASPLSVILVNFDRFNDINRQYGNLTGDRLLVETSRLISQMIRSSDTLARWSGEEFIILIPEKLRASVALAEKLRAAIENSSFSGLPVVSASFGVASYRGGERVEALLQRVDVALYKAKKNQGNRVASQE